MPDLRHAVRDALAADTTIAALATGGIYDRPLRRSGPRATPAAFEPVPPHRPLPSLAVIDGGEVPDREKVPGGRMAALNVWLRVADEPAEEERASVILATAASLLDGVVLFDAESGHTGMIEISDMTRNRDDPWIEGAKMSYLRLQIAGVD